MGSSHSSRGFWSCLKKAEELLFPNKRTHRSEGPLVEIEANLNSLFNAHPSSHRAPPPNPDVVERISGDELERAVKKLKRRKAAGVDGITNEHILFGIKVIGPILLKLFNAILQTGCTPKQWSVALVTTVYKKGLP